MSAIEWNEKFSVQIELVDEQHKVLFRCINDLLDALQTKQEHDTVTGIIHELFRYTSSHFLDEEALMKRANYPDLNAHIVEHGKFIQMIKDFDTQHKEGEKPITLGMIDYLVSWLQDHILGTDQKYVPFVKRK